MITTPAVFRALRRSAALVATALFTASCSERSAAEPVPEDIARIEVVSAPSSILELDSTRLVARAIDSRGLAVPGVTIEWSSQDTVVAQVEADGDFMAISPGMAKLEANAVSGQGATLSRIPLQININSRTLAAAIILPSSVSIEQGDSYQLKALAVDNRQLVLRNRQFDWWTDDAAVATVDWLGRVVGVGAGTTKVYAKVTGTSIVGSATINVAGLPVASVVITPQNPRGIVGDTIHLTAVGKDARGNVVPNAPVTWSSAFPQIATVNSQGIVTMVGAGPVGITARSGGVSATVRLEVSLAPVASIQLTPLNPALKPQQKQQFAALLKDARGNVLTGRPLRWTSATATVATIDANGMATAVSTGKSMVSVTAEGVTESTELTVNNAPVAAVIVTPISSKIKVGDVLTLSAIVKDAGGAILAGRSLYWSSSAPSVASVDAMGKVTALSNGTATISATSEGVKGDAQVEVSNTAVASVTLTPPSASLNPSGTVQLVAEAKSSTGVVLVGRPTTWSTDKPGVATVSSSGLVTGVSTGSATITVTIEGISQTAAITVAPLAVASVTINPLAPSVAVGGTVALSAVAKAANGTVLSGHSVSWSSSAVSKATVSAAGLVTAVAVGSATITATINGVQGTTLVTVTPMAVATVAVSPPTATMAPGATQGLTVVAKAANGTVISGRAVTWSSSAAAKATVSNAGMVTAVAPGTAKITAMIDGVPGTSDITVTTPSVASIVVTPNAPTIQTGGTQQLSAALTDAAGNPVTGQTVVWTTAATAIATVNSSGQVTGVSAGVARITATVGSTSGFVDVTVQSPTVASVSVSPNTPSISSGSTVALSANAFSSTGTVITGRPVAWASTATSIATVNSSGVVTGVSVGSAQIRATIDGIQGTATVTVTSASNATFAFCTNAGSLCLFEGLRDVRLQANSGAYVQITAYGQVPCATYGFNNQNPAPGQSLKCMIGPVKRTTMNNPMPGMSGLGAVVDVPMGDPGATGAQQQSGGGNGVSTPGQGSFRTLCSPVKYDFIDPIVYPGQPNASHLHTFFGNASITAYTTPASLVASGNSSCLGGTLNRSAYWMPSLFDTRTGVVQVPSDGVFYYKTGYNMRPTDITPPPTGLRMIAGNKSATGTQQYVSWVCVNGNAAESAFVPNCSAGDSARLVIIFPQCWDGVNLDSPDHKSHMSYPVYRNPPQNSSCPSSHPIAIPEITEHFDYLVTNASDQNYWRLSSDMYSLSTRGGASGHADWMNGWDEATMASIVNECLKKARDCGVGTIGGNKTLY